MGDMRTMSKDCKNVLKNMIHLEFCQTRDRLCYTQAQMAELLQISLRSYADIDRGKSMCSGETLLLFLVYCCADPNAFIASIKTALEKIND